MLPVRTPLDKRDVHIVICQFSRVVAECLLHAVSTYGRGACDTLTEVGENRTGCRRFQTSKMTRTGDVQTLQKLKNIHVSKNKVGDCCIKSEVCSLFFNSVKFRSEVYYYDVIYYLCLLWSFSTHNWVSTWPGSKRYCIQHGSDNDRTDFRYRSHQKHPISRPWV